MKTSEKMTEKRMYYCPEIILIELDNEISVALESAPPVGPGEGASLAPEFKHFDPYRNNKG